MRLVTYLSEGDERAGVQGADGVIDAAAVLGTERIGVRELIAGARLEELGEAVGATDAEPISRPELLPPLPDPDKIVCIGLNYRSHAEEAGLDPPAAPPIFAKFRNALVPDGAEPSKTLPGIHCGVRN